jgi:signal transduction histidine kinase
MTSSADSGFAGVSGVREQDPGNEKVKILLVDDKPQNLLALEAALADLGQELVKAGSGPEALRRVLTDDFAAILLDVRMPGMDGLETAALIRQREKSRGTPIIFLTAYGDEQQIFRGYDTGAVDYLIKPVVPEILRAKVAVFVELSKKNRFLERHSKLLESKNTELEQAVTRREQAESEVRHLNEELQQRLAEQCETNRQLEALYEKVKRLDRLKTQFFANASHELRTPLALVLGPIEKVLADPALNKEQRRQIEAVERNSRLLLRRVNDLLDISRLEDGKLPLTYAETDLAALVRSVVANFESFARDHAITLSLDLPESAPAQVDSEKLQRVLLNLFSNAFKFVPDGGRVGCELRVQEDRAVLAIADNGPGVPPDMREAIFERFRQGDRNNVQPFGGSGLGLSIVQEFVRLHGGAVAASDAPGGGAVVSLELPLAAPAGAEVGAAARPALEAETYERQMLQELRSARDLSRPRAPVRGKPCGSVTGDWPLVLVVEDNLEMNRFIAESLGCTYRIATAHDGVEGLTQAAALRPDLILLDVMMPRLSGDLLLRELRAHPALAETPVLILTARSDQDLRTSLLQEGAQDYISKPCSTDEMHARVRNLIAMKRAREVLQKELETRGQDLAQMAEELVLRRRLAEAALAEAEAANRAKDEFLATLSHELRTPLTAVVGWAGLLRHGRLDAEASVRALQVIERNARTQVKLIEDLLDTASLLTGKLRVELRPVELAPVIYAAIEAVRPTAEAAAIHLEAALDPDAGPVLGDAVRLQQTVWNLLSNAVKFTPKGGHVEVRLARADSHAEITVSDTGQGIRPDFLPRVFERFRQGDSSTTRAHGGLGLGLAIVHHLVDLHGGAIRAESDGPGRGSRFTIRLPLAEAARPAGAPANHAMQRDTALAGVHVLIVEDEPDSSEVIVAALQGYGARVTAAASTQEALEALERARPDIILSDIRMPHEDGYEFIRRVREIEAERGGFIPAAALTAHCRPGDHDRAIAAGFQIQISKPAAPAELAGALAKLVRRAGCASVTA